MNETIVTNAAPRPANAELPVPSFPWNENIEYVLARYERQLINHALAHADHVKRRAAMLLGISRYALERRLVRVAQLLDGAPAPVAATAGGKEKNRAAAGGAPTS